MKKGLILISIVLFTVFSVSAQTLVSKKGIPILPQKGDFAIGVAATPFLDFFGNIAKINSGTAFSSSAAWNALTPNVIYGKYFLTDNMAVRGKIRIGKNSKTQTESIAKSVWAVATVPEYVEDKWTLSTTDIVLSAGLEKRRGYGRLQGFYGAEATISLQGGSKNTFEYGNAIDATTPAPARTSFVGAGNSLGSNKWVTESSTGTLFGFGLGAFVGVEYFFAPKMSIGGEFGWGIGFNQDTKVVAGSTEIVSEVWDGTAVKSTTTPGKKTTTFNIDTKETAGNIFLLFHF